MTAPKAACVETACPHRVVARGMCQNHYGRWYDQGGATEIHANGHVHEPRPKPLVGPATIVTAACTGAVTAEQRQAARIFLSEPRPGMAEL